MSGLSGKRVLVTGGHGFLGQHVVHALDEAGVESYVPRRGLCNLLNDSQCIEYVREMQPDVIIHLAAYCGGIGLNEMDPVGMLTRNLRMAENIVEAAKQVRAKIVAVGSVCAYPINPPLPFPEYALWAGYPEPTNAPYGIAKRVLWSLLDAYHRQYGLRAAFLLPANLYGPGDNFDLDTSHVIPAMIRKFSESGLGTVKLWGTGNATRDFLYVSDAADAILRAAAAVDSPDPINIGSGRETSIRELASQIARVVAPGANVEWDESRPDGQPVRVLDTTRAEQLLGWRSQTALAEGLVKTVNWYRAQLGCAVAG